MSGPVGAAWALAWSPWTGGGLVDPYGYVLIGVPCGRLGSGVAPGKVPLPLPAVAVLSGMTVHVQGVLGLVHGGQGFGNVTGRLDITLF
ncbi:MAG: hypothetical protein JXR37_01795 [Kiritimatiellae bacterium]|nr:hypothetical protein [Kiritimatiellia bacterium]